MWAKCRPHNVPPDCDENFISGIRSNMPSIADIRTAERKHRSDGRTAAARKIFHSACNALLAWSRMGARRHLDTMSDHLLKDMGIQRHMIKSGLKYDRQ